MLPEPSVNFLFNRILPVQNMLPDTAAVLRLSAFFQNQIRVPLFPWYLKPIPQRLRCPKSSCLNLPNYQEKLITST